MRKLLRVYITTHKETLMEQVLRRLELALADAKHKDGEINEWEIRETYKGNDRRLRSG